MLNPIAFTAEEGSISTVACKCVIGGTGAGPVLPCSCVVGGMGQGSIPACIIPQPR
jgi:hypothetical protein